MRRHGTPITEMRQIRHKVRVARCSAQQNREQSGKGSSGSGQPSLESSATASWGA